MTHFHLMKSQRHKILSIVVLNMAKYTVVSLILIDFVFPIFSIGKLPLITWPIFTMCLIMMASLMNFMRYPTFKLFRPLYLPNPKNSRPNKYSSIAKKLTLHSGRIKGPKILRFLASKILQYYNLTKEM